MADDVQHPEDDEAEVIEEPVPEPPAEEEDDAGDGEDGGQEPEA